jgi:hypothetical protein
MTADMTTNTIAQRFAAALTGGDEAALDDLYAERAVLYHPARVFDGRPAIKGFIAELHRGFPGISATLHDEFYSADGRRGCLRQELSWHNSGSFYGNAPTGASGAAIETHTLKAEDGRIVEQVVGVSTFSLPRLMLAEWKMDFPREVPDPQPEVFAASPDTPTDALARDGHRDPSLALRFVDVFGRRDLEGLDDVYDENVKLYTPLGWPVVGRAAVKDFADQFHAANPGLRIALHDEFCSADGQRACWRIKLHYHNTQPFYGNPATDDAGVMTETHSMTLEGGKIVEQVVGDNAFHMPYQELVLWKMDFPTDTPDPRPAIGGT